MRVLCKSRKNCIEILQKTSSSGIFGAFSGKKVRAEVLIEQIVE